ncbi:ABC transporter permease [Sphingomonas kyeonggiensis]|uniref:ABC-2 type transport system permease protein n=1 Tax=Sphingomonas kyeonggiensis TaxID=1268553 RepID=A0A7W6JR39_9SPHN|nr:ABC transporter permease [Sphingomonas kyeonggiensis]MBB4097975.1 ABC-2 type transport system permease protein [Sphingomonas kyeonggiensis]
MEILTARELASLAIISVIFYAFYYPAPYAHQVATDLSVVVVDQDQTEFSRRLVRDLNATQSVQVVGQVADMAHGREILRDGRAEGVLLISKGLSGAIWAGRGGEGIGLVVEGSYFVRAENVVGAVSAAVAAQAARFGERIGAANPVEQGRAAEVTVQPLFNGVAGYRDYVFPSIAVVILQQTLLFTAARLVAERRRRREPPGGISDALGAWIACILTGLLGQAFFFGFAYWLQDVPRSGNMIGLLLAMPIFSAAVAALGLLLGTLFRDGDDALKLLMPTSVPLVFLTGFAWPLNQMPGWLAALSWLSPATAGVHSIVRFNQMGASLPEAAAPLGVLIFLTILFLSGWLWRSQAASPSSVDMDDDGRAEPA